MTSTAETLRINQINIPTDKVRWRLKQLTAEHIEYVIGSLEKNTTEIKNMRAYLLTALYNSIDTLILPPYTALEGGYTQWKKSSL